MTTPRGTRSAAALSACARIPIPAPTRTSRATTGTSQRTRLERVGARRSRRVGRCTRDSIAGQGSCALRPRMQPQSQDRATGLRLRSARRTGRIAGMRRVLVLVLALVLLAPGPADAKVRCHSGKTVFEQGRTRVFTLHQQTEFWVCSAVLRQPRLFANGNEGTLDSLYGWKAYGHRLSFIREWVGGDDLGWSAGWVDLHSGASAEATIQPNSDIPF